MRKVTKLNTCKKTDKINKAHIGWRSPNLNNIVKRVCKMFQVCEDFRKFMARSLTRGLQFFCLIRLKF